MKPRKGIRVVEENSSNDPLMKEVWEMLEEGLIERTIDSDGKEVWSINDAGREALKEDTARIAELN